MLEPDDRPGPPGATMLLCPVDDCPWRHQMMTADQAFASLKGTFTSITDATYAAITAATTADDKACRAHLADHPVDDLVRTIGRLRAALAAATA